MYLSKDIELRPAFQQIYSLIGQLLKKYVHNQKMFEEETFSYII